ncbi:MAG: sulfotransferase [Anaerolineae bacterium]
MTETATASRQIIYVGGAVRSGTTILDMLLGMNDNCLAVGEINVLFRQYGRTTNPVPCSCGRILRECDLWTEVISRFRAALPHITLEQADTITETVETFPKTRDADPLWGDYSAIWTNIIDSVMDISGATCIIDSSKSGQHSLRRALMLKRLGYRTSMLHMIRDPRAVAWSKLRRDMGKGRLKGNAAIFGSATYAAMHWNLTNSMTNIYYARQNEVPYFRTRYRDFVDDPAGKLREMERIFNIELKRSIEIVENDETIDSGHLASGNEIRLQAPLKVRKLPPDWKTSLPKAAKIALLSSYPVARYYGYRITDYS